MRNPDSWGGVYWHFSSYLLIFLPGVEGTSKGLGVPTRSEMMVAEHGLASKLLRESGSPLRYPDYLRVATFSFLCRIVCIAFTGMTAYIDPVYDLSQSTRSIADDLPTFNMSGKLLRQNDVLSSFSTWDSHHYLTISELGYIYEHHFAFHPLYPFITRALAGKNLNGQLT